MVSSDSIPLCKDPLGAWLFFFFNIKIVVEKAHVLAGRRNPSFRVCSAPSLHAGVQRGGHGRVWPRLHLPTRDQGPSGCNCQAEWLRQRSLLLGRLKGKDLQKDTQRLQNCRHKRALLCDGSPSALPSSVGCFHSIQYLSWDHPLQNPTLGIKQSIPLNCSL